MSVSSVRRYSQFLCNYCLCQLKLFESAVPIDPRIGNTHANKQYLTSCYHVLCDQCRMKTRPNCAVCKRKCQFMEISRKMPKHYQWVFERFDQIQDQLKSIGKFQQMQQVLATKTLIERSNQFERKYAVEWKALNNTKEQQKRAAVKRNKIQIIFNKIRDEKRRHDEEILRQRQRQQQQYQQQQYHRNFHQNDHQRNLHGNQPRQFNRDPWMSTVRHQHRPQNQPNRFDRIPANRGHGRPKPRHESEPELRSVPNFSHTPSFMNNPESSYF